MLALDPNKLKALRLERRLSQPELAERLRQPRRKILWLDPARIKERRACARMTQKELAEAMGLALQTIQGIENRPTLNRRVSLVGRLCEAMTRGSAKCRIGDLVIWKNNHPWQSTIIWTGVSKLELAPIDVSVPTMGLLADTLGVAFDELLSDRNPFTPVRDPDATLNCGHGTHGDHESRRHEEVREVRPGEAG